MALFQKKQNSQEVPPFGPPGGDQFGMPPDPYAQQQFTQQQPGFPPMGAPPQPQGFPGYEQPAPQANFGGDDLKGRVEEVAEAIIDEKWNELMKDINKVIEWKERSDLELRRLSQEILNLKERFDSLHKGILGKITEYDQNIKSVGSEIKAMEMTFQKILPTFTEGVNKLERYTKGMN